MLRNFTLFALIASISFSQEIGQLLKEYEEASELYRKTRKESLGHLILFTREDIDRMQARKLGDLLKSVRFSTIANNQFGIQTVNEYTAYSPIPRYIRLYINDHEVSSLHTGSPFLVWENFPLDHVNHVEIYIGLGAIELGNDPSMMIIKVYTKEPLKENASNLRTTVNSRGGYSGVFYSAGEINSSYSYMFMVAGGFDERKHYNIEGQTLSRDALYNFAFLGIYSNSLKLELGYGYTNRDPFIGFATDGVVESGYTKAQDIYVTLTIFPLENKTMKLVFSLDNHVRKHLEKSSSGLYIPVFYDPFNPLNNPKEFYEKAFFNKVDLYVSKEFTTKSNKLLAAMSYKIYNFDLDSRYYITLGGDRREVGNVVPFNRQEIYSLILEDQYSINPRNLIIGGIKFDKYYRNGGFKDFEEYILRLGYISLIKEHFYIKSFLSRSYIPPYFYDVESSGRDLDTIKIPFSITAEGGADFSSFSFKLGGAYARLKDFLIVDSSGRLINSSESKDAKLFFVEGEVRPAEGHKIQAGYSAFLNHHRKLSPSHGGHFRHLFTYGRLDFFWEFIYRSAFKFYGKRINEGYDLNGGVLWHVTERAKVGLKGENLLNKSSETPSIILPSAYVVSYPVRERTIYLSLEWFF